MLNAEPSRTPPSGLGRHFIIVASRYNARFVDGLLEGALAALRAADAPEPEVVRVPGAWEIPVIVAAITRRESNPPDAVICLGLILQGETSHARHIGEAVSDALMRLAVETGIPVIHEVLTVGTEAQAVARCLDPESNRGAEAAWTALEMAEILGRVRS